MAVATSSAAAIIIRYIMIIMSFSNPSESNRKSPPMTARPDAPEEFVR
jgi:hypothetical protein